ncbi:MAG: FMN-binding glutamate synthase family protein [Porticoccaceae bacterium]|nr:MAG: FMN-binding glutamate synthase family protein [Porticoccaceae bacterium]
MGEQVPLLLWALELFSALVMAALLALVVWVVVAYWQDVHQTRHTIRRNFPVLGRFRYFFEYLGEFFRQYFFAMDREELPFNRAQRSWVYRAAKGIDTTLPFGTTLDISRPGTIIFVPAPFPSLAGDGEPEPVLIGPHCTHPFETRAIVNISAMSFGALSRPAIEALSRGARKAGIWLNTGEGGLSPYHLVGGCDLVFQIGTAKYGVRDAQGNYDLERLRELAALPQIKMFELKLSQGAKPGKGGILPGIKVTEEIARIRGIPAGRDSLSPNGHPDIRSLDDLLERIAWLRAVTGKPVGFKMVAGDLAFFDDLCLAILHRGSEAAPDFITLDSGDGGTGAAPQSLMDHAGLSIRESLPLVVDKLAAAGLKERIRVIASGKLLLPADVAWALCAGADFVNVARGFMFALGCIQAMQCNRNTCPTGVTTHDPELQRGLDPLDKAERVANYARRLVREVAVIAHSCGVDSPRQLRREHARIVTGIGYSESLDAFYRKELERVKTGR